MKPNKVTTRILLLLFTAGPLFYAGCSDKKTDTTDADSINIPVPGAEALAVQGTWRVNRFYLAEISAQDEKSASEWLNKDLVIDDKLHFDFTEIKTYSDDFKDAGVCEIPSIDSPEVVPASEYFDVSRGLFTDLSLENTNLKIYQTSCQDHPFSEIILTEENELIIFWDGAFFVFTKTVKES